MTRKRPNLDTVTTINRDGSRFIVHPADVSGRYTNWRWLVAWVLIAIYVSLPWIPVGGYPAVFLDVMGRRFHLFGFTLATQDVWLLFFLVSGMAFGLFFVTALIGRVWCGWACPQTVFLEHVFRRVERWIDGDAMARRRLDEAPWTPSKISRRIFKHLVFILFSTVIAHVFLSYFVSIPQMWSWMLGSPLDHVFAFGFIAVCSVLLYVNFAWFREQLCIVICPYGRMQSVLVDEHTKNIAYDEQRGEPRGAVGKDGAGDCVDCDRCVQVCPTGIDIRQGLQLECVACANCIDACDTVMDRLGRPRGLIRYASEEELEGRKTRWIRPRVLIYTLLLFAGVVVATISLQSIKPFHAQVNRMVGAPFFVTDDYVRNQFRVRLINKSGSAQSISLTAMAADGTPLDWGDSPRWQLESMEENVFTWVVRVPRDSYNGGFPLLLEFTADPGGWNLNRNVQFSGPDPGLLRDR